MDLVFREATQPDLPAIVRLLADDEIGCRREAYADPLPECYRATFERIQADANSRLILACMGEEIVGFFQITFTQCLSHRGAMRATMENVRVAGDKRNQGIGTQLIRHAVSLARKEGAVLLQLMTDKRRPDARRFYEKNGFTATHEGMKQVL